MTETAQSLETIEGEARDAFRRYGVTRDRIVAGELEWTALEEFFTDDVVYIDPAWGRVEGIDAVRGFWVESMGGLDDWKFPEAWTVVEGHRVVTMWIQEMGPRPDGGTFSCPGMSVLYYAGDGKFCYEMDIMNMAHVMELVGEMGWVPPEGFTMPPAAVERDISLPPGREHLAQ